MFNFSQALYVQREYEKFNQKALEDWNKHVNLLLDNQSFDETFWTNEGFQLPEILNMLDFSQVISVLEYLSKKHNKMLDEIFNPIYYQLENEIEKSSNETIEEIIKKIYND